VYVTFTLGAPRFGLALGDALARVRGFAPRKSKIDTAQQQTAEIII